MTDRREIQNIKYRLGLKVGTMQEPHGLTVSILAYLVPDLSGNNPEIIRVNPAIIQVNTRTKYKKPYNCLE